MRFRFFTIGLACAGAAGGVLAAMACIPDLPGSQGAPVDASADGTGAGKPFCGDGVIDPQSGEQCDPGPRASPYCTADCRVVCDGGFLWSRNDHCYYDLGASQAFSEALVRCASPAHVVTFASEAELEAVLGGIDAGPFWVGLTYDPSVNGYTSAHALEPGWSQACSGCFAHASPGALTSPPDAGPCVQSALDPDASWQQTPCLGLKSRLRVLCEREPVGDLARDCMDAGASCIALAWTSTAKRYVYFRNAAPPEGVDGSAEQTCASLGGTLVVLQSRDEREELWRAIGATQTQSAFWIGLSIPQGGTSWTWADDAGEDAYPSPWAARQPRDDAGTRAYLFQNGEQAPAIVEDTLARNGTPADFPFVCQLPP